MRVVLRLVLDDDESGDARLAAMLGEKAEGVAASRVRAVREALRDACVASRLRPSFWSWSAIVEPTRPQPMTSALSIG